MTPQEKQNIDQLRSQGLGYKLIARQLSLPEGTVKTYFRRNPITPATPGGHFCLNCGAPAAPTPGKKEKKFCSDSCRNKWWNSHQDQVKRKAVFHFTCPTCGQEFTAYAKPGRKYCSHACYIQDRFGGAACE